MFTLIRMGKDRKDIDKDWTLCNVLIIFIQYGVSEKEKGSIFSSQFPLETFPPHSFSSIKFSFNNVTIYWFQLFSLNSSSLFSQYCSFSFLTSYKFLLSFRLYRHHTTTIMINCQFSSCCHSRSYC